MLMQRICRSTGLIVVFAMFAWLCLAAGAETHASEPAENQTGTDRGLIKLDEKGNVWLDNRDPKKRRVALKAKVVLREGVLEMLCCLKGTKEHESILAVDTKAYVIHTALVAAGAKPGTPVQFRPEYRPPTGQEVDVFLEWKGEEGKLERMRAQEWVRDMATGKAMTSPWVFAGSGFYRDPTTGERYYLAEEGDLICVANFLSATLDLSARSSQSSGELMFEPFVERIPKVGTPVTIYLEPVVEKKAPAAKASP